MGILQLISTKNFISVNKVLIKQFGLEGAVLLGELASEYDYWHTREELDKDGYFFTTVKNIEENTTLSEYKQTKAINKLKKMGVIDTKVQGLPAKRYIKINEENLYKCLDIQVPSFSGTGSREIQELDTEKFGCNNNIYNNNIINNKDNIYDQNPKCSDIEKDFEELWKLYPKKQGKTNSLKAYKKAVKKGVTKETVKQGIEHYIQYIQKKKIQTQYIKQGSTWFNQECWNDVYEDITISKQSKYNASDLNRLKDSNTSTSSDIDEMIKRGELI